MKPIPDSFDPETSPRHIAHHLRAAAPKEYDWRRLRRKMRHVLHDALIENAWDGEALSPLVTGLKMVRRGIQKASDWTIRRCCRPKES
jgi:hypothetical protein